MISLFFILIGIFLRQYDIANQYIFSGELGKEFLYVRYLIENHVFPIIGQTTSHEWLSYGPIYYWILIPLTKIINFNPFILFWLAFIVSVLGLFTNYLILKKITNKNIAIFSTILISLSPLFIWQTRLSKLHVFFFLLTPILIYLLYRLWQKDNKYLFWTGLTFGIFFSFHFSQIPLIFVIFLVMLIKKYKLLDYLKLSLGIVIPNLGIITKDLKIFLWLPYRTLGLSKEVGRMTLLSFNEFFGRLFFWDKNLWIVGSILSLVILYLFIKYFYKTVNKNFFNSYLISSTLIIFGGLILHKNPPVHYFLPIFPNIFYMASILIDKYLGKLVFYVLCTLFLVFSLRSFDSPKGIDFIPISKQIKISKNIVTNYVGQEINIKRIGPFDYFPENYSQNYKFLIWYLGGRISENSKNIVVINDYENINTK